MMKYIGVPSTLLLNMMIGLCSTQIKENINPYKQFHITNGDDRQNKILFPKNVNATEIKQATLNEELRENRPLPASIEVKLGSTLSADPNTRAIILFEVTNNRPFPVEFSFNFHDNDNYIRRVYPTNLITEEKIISMQIPWDTQGILIQNLQDDNELFLLNYNEDLPIMMQYMNAFCTLFRAFVTPGSTVLVKVEMFAENIQTSTYGSNPDTVTLTAEWLTPSGNLESVTKQVFFYIQSQQYDATNPYIWYDYAGDCSGSLTPQNCHAKSWRANISVQDATSGLLSFRSDPVGLMLSKEFIVGTRDQVTGSYGASCCHTKVDIIATDVLGNSITKTIDIEKKWLNTGEISAIVLGSILLLLLIVLIIIGIVACVRRNKRTLNIYPDHRIAD